MNLSTYFVLPPPQSCDVIALALAAARGGATAIQLRDKTGSDAEVMALARALIAVLDPMGVPLIVNDRAEIARDAGAAGLHIGQTDGDPVRARAIIGPGKVLGLSIETRAQLAAIPAGVVDHLGVGPVFGTPSKTDHATPIGLDGLARIVADAPLPSVAIGGLKLDHTRAVRAAGAAGMAVISAISAAPDPQAATRALANAWRDA